ncbi:hypothetical protein [Micromonospora rosaria]|uniref:hypothetical protein n=1 Tax=Micromonospora rosaria TaxID=47874 RepID=UPI000B2B0C5E|nr:hypothetical protein [Micromonospora rosaria]
MVIRRTINDWYTNVEGRDSTDSRHDWENDEKPDRTPDAWLDRLQPEKRTTGTSGTAQRGRPGAGAKKSQPSRSQRDLAKAAHALVARERGIQFKAIAQRLRSKGWPKVTTLQVADAMHAHPATAAKTAKNPAARRSPSSTGPAKPARKKQPPSYGTITIISPPTAARQQAKPAAATGNPQPLVEVVRKAWRANPRISIKKLAKQVRARGWPRATTQEVQAALEAVRSAPTSTVRRVQPPAPLAVKRTLHPDACFACGVVPSALGACRCS